PRINTNERKSIKELVPPGSIHSCPLVVKTCVDVRSHERRETSRLFRNARDSGRLGRQGIPTRSSGRRRQRTARVKAIPQETTRSEAASKQYRGAFGECSIRAIS